MKVLAVNGRLYNHDLLADAIKASKDGKEPIVLLVVDDEYVKTVTLDYHGGEKFPQLVRNEKLADGLSELAKARSETK